MATKEKFFRVYEDDDGGCVQIENNPDAPDFGLLISTPTKEAEEWFGKIYFCMGNDTARKLAEAILEMLPENKKE